jgi:lysophospholipase L1-like esterase
MAVRLFAAVGWATACAPASLLPGSRSPEWFGNWMAAPQLVEPRNMPPAPGLTGSTLRQVVRLSVGGVHHRLRISNEFGDGLLRIGAVHAARSAGRDSTDAQSDVALQFGGDSAAVVAAGTAILSEPFDMACDAFCDLAVSVYVVGSPGGLTGHPGSRATSYLVSGNRSAAPSLSGATRTEHWYLLSGVETVWPSHTEAVVVLGNSIADGRGSGTDRNTRWPDNLARRLRADARTSRVAVLNAGIGGNAVVRGGLGPPALERFDRDVLNQSGVRWVIVSEGVNDIGGAGGVDSSAAVARHLIDAYRELIARGHGRGLRVYGATILPFGGSFYDSADRERARQTVNEWVRAGNGFDGVIDFDAALRDPAAPSRLLREWDGGDHLHPNEAGYHRMGEAVELGLFLPPR